ncbi:hypothetical protein [Cutibacterium modestum]|jgi:hypothetical protein|uniref:Uncharacterized protein n=2 Tax=Cutibacterium modestum TaxID=2559073 RepID=A0AAD1KQB4_9ACTN|nr:hypothetical protein [Cutibacterium modestum]EFS74042.1 hypothetical protein HMPREF9621_01580 [Cutibacterium modestum HL037PA2]EFS92623.1 hypothetical protein HMPREF9607_01153 [Cutibacterium modestum HL044PA1]EFT15270.1 hypothetical protein HMPREF9622_01636 [Cutibacterium modestum HL037PA3]EGG26234.1 hypothetical protein PA08_2200 [Cutibacterium modestum P08]BCY26218.1 hypothetical protein KB1_22080 [Cutibacterium modestum]
MKLTTTLEHRTRSVQSPITSAFGGASVTVDLLAPGGSTCSSAGSRRPARRAL